MLSEALALNQRERRTNRRFPLSLKLRYLLPNLPSGDGEVLDISSGGIRFQSTGVLPVGEAADLILMWPYLLNGDCPLQLMVQGRVLRSGPQGTALKISRYEFRTAPRAPAGGLTSLDGGKSKSFSRMRLVRWK